MSIAAIVRALVQAGATPEMILAAVEAAEQERARAEEARKQAKREGNAERQRRFRERNARHALQTQVTRDAPLEGPPSPCTPFPPYIPPTTPHSTAGAGAKPDVIAEPDHEALGRSLTKAAGKALANAAVCPGLLVLSDPLHWIRSGCDLHADILPAITARCSRAPPGTIRSWSYFTAAVFEARDNRLRPPEPIHDRTARHQTQSAARASEPRGHGAVLAAAARLKARLGDADPRREVVSPDDDGGGPTLDLAASRRA